MKCRLCRQMGLVVCLSIFVIEVAILVPSYLDRRVELLAQLEARGISAMSAALRDHDHHALTEIVRGLEQDSARSALAGGAIYGGSGQPLVTFGEPPMLSPDSTSPGAAERRRWIEGDRLEVMWPANLGSESFILIARMNAEDVEGELFAFVGRVGGLVLIISVFVSAATVAALSLLVLRPLLEIRRHLGAAEDDPVNAELYKLDFHRDDEIGETASAINALLERLSALRRSDVNEREQRLKDFGDASSDWFWEMDENLRFSYFSDRFVEVTGVSQESLLGKTRQETGIPGVDARAWQEHLENLAARRPFRDFVHPRTRSDGRVVYLSINGKPIFDEHGNFKGFRGTGRDITQMKRREDALRDAKRQAEIANRAKSEFLANMSHELRTPLNAVIGFAEIMKEGQMGPIGNPRYLEYVSDIHESGRHLLHLINDVLDLSKIETGNAELDEEELDVGRIIDTCIRLIRPRAEAGRLEIAVDLPDAAPIAVRADPRMLKQILVNLLSNAVKFTPAEGRIEIAVRCDAEDGLSVRISDTGIGIEPTDIPKALARFQQVDGRLHRKYEGSGLGLSLAKSLTELHGGSLDLQSDVGVGTAVTVTLPPHRVCAGREPGSFGGAKIAVNARHK